MIEHDSATFTVFTVTPDDVQVTPMTVTDDGQARAFYLIPWMPADARTQRTLRPAAASQLSCRRAGNARVPHSWS